MLGDALRIAHCGAHRDGRPQAASLAGLLRALLDELPVVQAETFALRVALGYSMQEVADATSAPVNTVRSRLRLAKEALRHRIEQDATLTELLGDEP